MTAQHEHSAAPRIAIIGGTGLYSLPGAEVLGTPEVATPFGAPSGPITIARVAGRPVVFLSRHGRAHSTAPQQINYRANLWALKSLGVEAVVSSAAVGSLSPRHGTGTFAVPDQFIDRTWGRADTYFDGSLAAGVQHLPAAEPFCPALRSALAGALAARGESFDPSGTVAVINGPRFSTKAESAWLLAAGAGLVSMTQYPEPVLAAELNMGFATLAYITDADTGHDGSEPVTAELVLGRLAAAQPRILAVLEALVSTLDGGYRARALMPAAAVQTVLAAAVQPAAQPAGGR
ncbi:MAG: S-methyl-5'-thioinosine phosphorylase [Actinomycetales bacterium]|jgi:5'-methylthioadenosine phosphorylase